MAPRILSLFVIPVLLTLPVFFLLAHWVRMRGGQSFLTAVAVALGAAATVAWRAYQFDHQHLGLNDEKVALMLACTALLVMFAVPLGIKLYRAWTGIRISPEEQSPGAVGVRAWLSPGNLIVSALVAGCAAGAYDYQFLGVFGLLVGCLLIQPLLNTAGAPAPAATPEPTLTAEREKVLSLLEAGRITAEESADLLNALGNTTQAAAPAAPMSRQRRMALIGAGLVLLGFFLPWFSINPGKELGRMTGQMQGMMEGMPGMEMMPGIPVNFGTQVKTPTVHVSGGDVGKGLGWLVLLLGLGTAALPYAAATMDTATQRMISFIALGIGGIVLLWLVSQNLRFINAGAILALAGYAVEFLGLLKPRPRTAVESGVAFTGAQ
jgi:hypothetical protein